MHALRYCTTLYYINMSIDIHILCFVNMFCNAFFHGPVAQDRTLLKNIDAIKQIANEKLVSKI